MGIKRISKQQKWLICFFFLGSFIAFFNQTTINPALPTIINEFSVSASHAQWLTSGYLMVIAIMIPINAYLIKRFDTKRIFLLVMMSYTIGCLLTAFGHNFVTILLGRLIQGFGNGILMPTTMAVLLYIVPVKNRGSAFGFFGLLIGLAPIMGPAIAGFVVDSFTWRYIYIGVGVCTATMFLLALFIMPKMYLDNNSKDATQKLDILSFILSTLGLGLLLFGLAEFSSLSHLIVAIISILAGLVFIFLFVRRQIKIPNFMLNVRVLKNRQFYNSVLVMIIIQVAFSGAIILLPLLLQDCMGYSASVSGLAMIPSAVLTGILAPLTGKLFDKYGIRYLAIIGVSLMIVASFMLSFLTEQSSLLMLIVCLCIRNAGAAFVILNINTWGINSLSKEDLSHGNSVSNTCRQVSSSLGTAIPVALYALILNNCTEQYGQAHAGIMGTNLAFAIQGFLCILALIICIFCVSDKKHIRYK